MNLRIANNKPLYAAVIALATFFAVLTVLAVGAITYVVTESTIGGILGGLIAAAIMAWPLIAGRRETRVRNEYYDSLK